MINKIIKYQDLDKIAYKDIKSLYTNHINITRTGLLSCFGSGRVLVKKAIGSKIYLKNRKIILDASGGFGVLNHGHNHPRIIKARLFCLKQNKMEVNKSFLSPALAALSSNICKLLPPNLDYAFFPNSGSEAIDVAMRLALKVHQNKRNLFLSTDIAFHGKSLGPQSISNSGENTIKLNTLINNHQFKYNSIESFDKAIKKTLKPNGSSKVAAVIIEPFSASTITESSKEFLLHVRKVCTKKNIILIFDEVYSGFFKTGSFFNFMRVKNLSPDILCFAKALGGGKSSIAGVVYSKKINKSTLNDINSSNYLSSTYYGFYEECITAMESIQITIDERYDIKIANQHIFMSQLAEEIKNIYGNKFELKGSGQLWGLFIHEDYLPKSLKSNSFIKKVLFSSAINWLFEKKNVLTALSFGIEPHLIISLNFAYTDNDLKKLRSSLFDLMKTNLLLTIPSFFKNILIKK